MAIFKKALKWFGISLLSLILTFCLLVLILTWCRIPMYSTYYANVGTSISIPGLDDPYCPQGVAYVSSDEVVITSGYMTNGENSRLYLTDKEDNSKQISLENPDGSTYTSHLGGIAYHDGVVYLADDHYVQTVSYEALKAASDKDTVKIENTYPVSLGVAYIFAAQNYLYCGEFYRAKNYETDPSHHYTYEGQEFKAIVQAIPYENFKVGETAVADHTISVPNEVQGFCITSSGKIVVSISWSIKNSRLITYENVLENNSPLDKHYYLDKGSQVQNIAIPPMSEDLDYYNGNVYINFESACKKYSLFNIYPTTVVTTYPVA